MRPVFTIIAGQRPVYGWMRTPLDLPRTSHRFCVGGCCTGAVWFWVKGLGSSFQGLGFRVEVSGYEVQGSEFGGKEIGFRFGLYGGLVLRV